MPNVKVLLIAAGVAVAAAAVIGVIFITQPCACEHESASPDSSVAPVQNTPPSLPTACGANPAPAVNVASSEFGYRVLTAPGKEQPVSSPMRVAGQMRPFEGAFTVTILDRQQRLVASQEFSKSNTGLAFEVAMIFEVTSPLPACVWVHERSGNDGSPTNITQVPVLLLP